MVDGFGGDPGTGYFGVYDGHGGRNVAEFLRLHLHVNVERELLVKGDRSVEECLRAAFLYTDMSCHGTGEQASGSTAVVCIVRRAGDMRCVYTANCGDARAVLCHGGAAVRLSKVRVARLPSSSTRPRTPTPAPHLPIAAQDHKATDAIERARIEAGGGFVVRKRVMGVLAVARSFGDFVLKKFVSAEPYTSTTVLDDSSMFIIIACDGVWDVLEDQEAVDMVRSFLVSRGGDLEAGVPAAQILVDAALAKGSSDNVTAAVVLL